MKAEQIDRALRQKFIEEDKRLVFWHDAEGEFEGYVTEGFDQDLAKVNVLDVSAVGGFSAKLKLERDDPEGKYLVYTKGEVPPAEENWLLDIRLYSTEFHADVANLWMEELGLTRLAIRDHVKARAAFMNSQGRRKKLAQFTAPNDDEATLDLKMLAVLAGSPVATPFDVLSSVCHNHVLEGTFDLNATPEVLATFEKMDLTGRFWQIMAQEFDYVTDAPTLASLLHRLFLGEVFNLAGEQNLGAYSSLKLSEAGRRNAVVFLTQWRDSATRSASYEAAAHAVAQVLHVTDAFETFDLDTLRKVYTFWEAEAQVVERINRQLLDEALPADAAHIATIAGERTAGYWLAGPGSDQPDRQCISEAYAALSAATALFAMRDLYGGLFSFHEPAELFNAYQKELYKLDRLYRDFCTHARRAGLLGYNGLKALAERVESVYDQGYLQPMGRTWSGLLDGGFLDHWELPGVPRQQNFYADHIAPHVEKSQRAFVIISDAFRYEAATELVEALQQYRIDAELTAMLGVLPSYTQIGMASLLPHQSLSYKGTTVQADGQSTSGLKSRDKILQSVNGLACNADDLRKMKRQDTRALTKAHDVVYIYHNVIDARGEAATESETFQAVSECIEELVELVNLCTNSLNATRIWITADHGFLFQQEAPVETDKSKLKYAPADAILKKKRFIIGENLGTTEEAHLASLQTTARVSGGLECWVPRAANRFHFVGGARFFHGGAMPQEIVVPLLTVTQRYGKDKAKTRVEKVGVQVLGTRHLVTTPVHRFELIQTEAASDRRKPVTLRIALYENDTVVSSVETVLFESVSDRLDDRKKTVLLKLGAGPFNKQTPYRLVLRDAETEVEVLSIPVVIDRSFEDDF